MFLTIILDISGSEGSEQIQQSLRYNVHKNLAECYNNSGELLLAEDHFFQVFNDQTVESLDKYCSARQSLDKKLSPAFCIPDAALRRSHLYSPEEEKKVEAKPFKS